MNIIKLKDAIKPNDEYFNKHLKGKYAYWVHMRYIVSFDDMDYQSYVACEENISKLLKNAEGQSSIPYYDMYADFNDECSIGDLIDVKATDDANLIRKYVFSNQYSTTHDLTIDEVKLFRTWLATTLLTFDADNLGNPVYDVYNESETHMLLYYANNMFDDTLKFIDMFNQTNIVNTSKKSCGCCGNSDLSSLYSANLNICNGVDMYKRGVYNVMVSTFSNIDFWMNTPNGFLTEFKNYVDNIIKTNLPLKESAFQSNFQDCSCAVDSNNNLYHNMLVNLSLSLDYMINDSVFEHKLFIYDSLSAWAQNLYEVMQW